MAELKCPEGSSFLRDAPRSQCPWLGLVSGGSKALATLGLWWCGCVVGNSNPMGLIDSSLRPRVFME